MRKKTMLFLICLAVNAIIFVYEPVTANTELPANKIKTSVDESEPTAVEPAEETIKSVEIECEISEPNSRENNFSAEEPDDSNTPEIKEQTAEEHSDSFNIKFSPIFETYVNEEGMVNYNNLRRRRGEIDNLLRELASLEPEVYKNWPDSEKIAFWINTYNLKMLDIIISNYPIESTRIHRLFWPPNSIRHIQPRNEVGSVKWNNYKFIVMDEEFTLFEIENRFFREKFGDPRVFLALSLASKDGPPLRNEAYTGKNLDNQLEDQAKRFLNKTSGLTIKRDNNQAQISAIFDGSPTWYGNEFLKYYATDKKFKSHTPLISAVLNFATKYLPSQTVDYLETGNYTVQYKTYDWGLNEQ
ncbi:MAG: DUF547 domain-containing protein [Phycisphaerae bacterium]